ncbi:glycoside hydrolase family 3 C-terminal domain-containing protein [uncultured Aquimarina sp.]|uniref:glycoside hydrolase family 3 C-terminal domain-containing protein n=1 Tax=uncultured Aquimarina sp. TaxID=575652 RepID=UPI00262755C7|nr:glycoside hydrolase family 3 C-terminal domain-containing protein [uncultured Aquimarina sp.]
MRYHFIISFIVLSTISISEIIGQTQFKWFDESLSFEKRISLLIQEMTLDEKCKQLLNNTPAIPRLGIPKYDWWNEALHGVARNGKATIFPQAIGMAATFDPKLIKTVASTIADEGRAKFKIAKSIGNREKYSGLTYWTPNVNIFRDPRWGRGQETYGEDPYLTSQIGTAFVQGLQGNHPKYLKSVACAKHYAVHSGPEALRHSFNVNPSKLDLYETYLPAFETLVKEANVKGIMGAYNAVYEDPSCSSDLLLNQLLKKQWGFDGYVVSDCGALGDIFKGHKVAKSEQEAAAMALKAGVNLNCGWIYSKLPEAVKEGLIEEALIDERLKDLLLIRFKLGFFDKEESNPFNLVKSDIINSEENQKLAKTVAQKSIVLLKNDHQVLPLRKDISSLYVTGPFAASNNILIGNYYGMSSNLVTVLEGVAEKVSLGTSLNYRQGVLPFQKNLNPLNWAPQVAKTIDATIMVVGISNEVEGEEVDAIASTDKGDRKDLQLPQSQIDYIKEISEVKKGPLILVVGAGSPVSLDKIEPLVDAILLMWYPGEQGGNALADIIFGDVAPSGHLPVTFPKNVGQLPPFEDYSMKGRTYKYMTKEPMYPFGYGLSYSSAAFTNLNLSKTKIKKNEELEISVTIQNTNNSNYEEVVQLYLIPEDKKGFLPFYALKRFKRVLVSNKPQNVKFVLNEKDFVQTNLNGEKEWIKGKYRISISNALPSERSVQLGASKPISQIVELL